MPPRLVCLAILVYWAVAAVGLVNRDLIPELSVGGPPDLRTIASAGEDAGPVRWSVQVIDNPARPEERRNVGQALTESKRSAGGWIEMTSTVSFDSGQLLKNTALAPKAGDRIEFKSTYEVDPSGNLRSFHAGVRSESDLDELLRIDGRLKFHATEKKQVMEVVARGPLPFLNRTVTFEYQDRGVVGSNLGPLDRLPGLQVGQRWDERVANPLSGQVETVRAEVKARDVIYWNQGPVETLVVVHQSPGLSARTWVRRDGVVLRQEVPFPLLRLVLDRQPDRNSAPDGANGAR
jgi:hypothetical protein